MDNWPFKRHRKRQRMRRKHHRIHIVLHTIYRLRHCKSRILISKPSFIWRRACDETVHCAHTHTHNLRTVWSVLVYPRGQKEINQHLEGSRRQTGCLRSLSHLFYIFLSSASSMLHIPCFGHSSRRTQTNRTNVITFKIKGIIFTAMK